IRVPRYGGVQLGAVGPVDESERRQQRKSKARADQCLEVPRTLNREAADQHRRPDARRKRRHAATSVRATAAPAATNQKLAPIIRTALAINPATSAQRTLSANASLNPQSGTTRSSTTRRRSRPSATSTITRTKSTPIV